MHSSQGQGRKSGRAVRTRRATGTTCGHPQQAQASHETHGRIWAREHLWRQQLLARACVTARIGCAHAHGGGRQGGGKIPPHPGTEQLRESEVLPAEAEAGCEDGCGGGSWLQSVRDGFGWGSCGGRGGGEG